MPTLNIEGRRVKVDESFLSLSPEQQSATVDEIAATFTVEAPQPKHVKYSGPKGRLDEGYEPPSTPNDKLGAFANSALDLPIVGPLLTKVPEYAAAGITSALGRGTFGEELKAVQSDRNRMVEENPNTALAGNAAGNIAAMGALGATGAGARVLGMSQAGLPARAGMSLLSGAGISGADNAVRGGDAGDIAVSALTGGLLSGAIPIAGAALQKGYRAVADGIGSRLRGAINPEQVAGERVGSAIAADRANPGDRVLGAADDATAALNGQPLINIDRGGETTRALARVVSNTNPEARATINNLADERFASQSDRSVDFVKRIMGGNVDDLAVQERIRDVARITNRKAYDAAEASPNAAVVWDGDLAQLMQSPTMQRAATGATSRGADRAAVEGGRAVKNPFAFVEGQVALTRQADGAVAYPNLRFWDQVKRNLDGEEGMALRSGDKTRAADIRALRSSLVQKLDGLVPQYKSARQGASAAFGAEDAVDAGRVFARQTGNVPEMDRAIATMTRAEKKAFEVGYSSEIIDRIRSTNDRSSAVRMFKSLEMRAKFNLALGPQKTRELEAFVKVEDAMDKVRGAMGNSTTARQLYEMAGIGAVGGGASYATGDPKYMAYAAAAGLTRFALRQGTAKIDERVMKKVADLLVSDDPQAIERAVRQAAFAPQYLAAVEALSNAAGVIGRVGALGAAQ